MVINLIPWREAALKYEKMAIRRVLFCCVAVTSSLLLMAYHILHLQETRLQRTLILLNHHLSLMQSAFANFPTLPLVTAANKPITDTFTRDLFAILQQPLQEEVCLTEVKRQKNKVTFIGRAPSVLNVTQFLQTWPGVALFADIKIDQLITGTSWTTFVFHGAANSVENMSE